MSWSDALTWSDRQTWAGVSGVAGAPDVTPPTFAGSISLAAAANDSLTFEAEIDEGGTVYIVLIPQLTEPTGIAPGVADVKAGQDGNQVNRPSNSAVLTANTPGQIQITGLSTLNPYWGYAVATDSAGNDTAVVNMGRFNTSEVGGGGGSTFENVRRGMELFV